MTRDVPRVAIVGAGISGLSCAQTLREAGVAVTVFDKGRGPGGRASTRRGAIAFDHGAQYFTVADPTFRTTVDRWLQQGTVAAWSGRVVAIDRPGVVSPSTPRERFVGVPGMSAIAGSLAQSLDVRCGVTVAPPDATATGWLMHDTAGQALGAYEAVVLTAPPVQTAALLRDHPLERVVTQAEMTPCLAVMVAWDDDLDLGFDGAFVNVGPLAWIARNGSKPGRHDAHSWVLHASGAWSSAHVEVPPDACVSPLLEAFGEAVGLEELPTPSHVAAHRWRYALPTAPLDVPCLWDAATRVGVAGDWCGGPRLEGAWLSGRAVAHRMLDGW